MAPVVIRIGRRRSTAAPITASDQAEPRRAPLIGEFHDQDAVLGDEADERHQADLAVDVERAAGEMHGNERAGHGERHGQHDDEGSRKLSNWADSTR